MDLSPVRRLALKLAGSQKMHPKLAKAPSRLGQPQPASRPSFQTFVPNLFQ
jgi:hypothetical protein